MTGQGRLFISHASADNAETLALKDWLRDEGWSRLFLDIDEVEGIKAGTRWRDELANAIRQCDAVLVLLSPAWTASRWCLAELNTASLQHKPVIACIVKPLPYDEIPAALTAEWQIVDLTQGVLDHIVEVPYGDGNQPVSVAFSSTQLRRLKIGLQSMGVEAGYFTWPPPGDPGRLPYPGLAPLLEEDAGIYFGRDGKISDALKLLRRIRSDGNSKMMVILGASGSGKSSFMRAGLLPRLKRDDRHFLCLPAVRPAMRPLTGQTGLVPALVAAFRAAGIPRSLDAVEAAVEAGPQHVHDMLWALVAARPVDVFADTASSEPTLVLPVDQGEELLVANATGEAGRFLELIEWLMTRDRGENETNAFQLVVLMTIRTDHFDAFQSLPREKDIQREDFSLPPMPIGEYGEVIRGPGRRQVEAGRPLAIDDALIDALLSDIQNGGTKDSLPLLAFTLQRMYRRFGDSGAMTLEGYEKLGRLRGSITAAIERVMELADEDRRIPVDRKARMVLMRRGLIPWLAGIDPETNAVRRRIARMSEIPEEARPLMDIMLRERLLSSDRDPENGEVTVEPAHEALLRQWSDLDEWLKERLSDYSTVNGVQRAAMEWAANGRSENWLSHRGDRLKHAEVSAEKEDFHKLLEPTDFEYIDACRTMEEAIEAAKTEALRKEADMARRIARTLKRLLNLALATTGIVAVAAVLVFYLYRQAEAERTNALAALDVIHSQDALLDGDFVDAVSSGLSAFRRVENEETRSAFLGAALEISPYLDFIYPLANAAPMSIAWRSDGRLDIAARQGFLLTVPSAGDAFRRGFARKGDAPEDSTITVGLYPAFGGMLGLLAEGGLLFYDGRTSAVEIPTEADDLPLKQRGVAADASQDGHVIAAVTANGMAAMWSCHSKDQEEAPVCKRRLADLENVTAVTVGADGTRILAGDSYGIIREIGGDKITDTEFAYVPGGIEAMDLSRDGRYLATARANGEVYVLNRDIGRGGQALRIAVNGSRVPLLAWSPARDELLYACGSTALCLWRVGAGQEQRPASFFGHSQMILQAAWAEDGERVASIDGENLLVWTRTPDVRVRTTLAGPDIAPKSFALNRATGTSAIGDEEGCIWLVSRDGSFGRWDVENAPKARVSGLAWGADGRLAALFRRTGFAVGATSMPGAFRAVEVAGEMQNIAWAGGERLALMPIRSSEIAIAAVSGGAPTVLLPKVGEPVAPWGAIANAAGDLLYANYTDGSLRRWAIADATFETLLEAAPAGPNKRIGMKSLVLSGDERTIATTEQKGNIMLVDVDGGGMRSLRTNSPTSKTVAFSPAGDRLAALSTEGDLYVWRLADDERILSLRIVPQRSFAGELKNGVMKAVSLDWFDDGHLAVATGTGDVEIVALDAVLWEERAGAVLRHFK
ncbi:nSTAND1 domain-containing NTPase [Rhizobium sp. SL86]|uniref:nSTAND1 domain-containing NTPase n=1 Tax=Rhizobium sp. SL86 TaxID=2995148 RepID=UPI0022768A17|nr:TIR domain-containing protein [Rhizobium sp. SL86]MCY1669021.1 TIR domain-containing protein [Rhizobium sp. SL86]